MARTSFHHGGELALVSRRRRDERSSTVRDAEINADA